MSAGYVVGMAASSIPSTEYTGAVTMLERLARWLAGRADPIPLEDAVAAVLMHIATLTGAPTPRRQQAIHDALARYTGLSGDTVEALIERAGRREAEAPDLHRFVRAINRDLSNEQRKRVLALAYDVAFADHAGSDEEGALRLLGGLLGISDHERGVIRQQVLRAQP